jgi:DNA primase
MLDGDQAGTRAALRLIDLALPMLQGGKTLRFALLPQGQDPDDLIRSQGAPAIAAQLNAAKPLVDILWMRETEGHVFDTPERRAALDARLRQAVLQIQDKSLRHHYGQALAEKRRALFRPVVSQARRWQKGGFGAPQGPLAETRATALAAGQMAGHDLRIALIVASLYRYPEFLPQFEAQLERLWPDNVHYRQLIDLLLDHAPQDEKTARDVAQSQGIAQYLDAIHSIGYVKITPFLRGPKDPDKAQICLEEEFSKLAAATIRQTELRETTEDFAHHDDVPPELSNRLQQAVNMIRQAAKPAQSAQSDRTEDTSALSQNLHALIEAQIWVKKTKR